MKKPAKAIIEAFGKQDLLDLLKQDTIWVLIISTSAGNSVFAYYKEEDAIARLWEFVCEWWESDGPGGELDPDATGSARDNFIHAYFDTSGEDYSIDRVNIQ